MNKIKVLITGATGFIGRNLIKRLLTEADYKVVCLVRETSKTDFLKEKGIDLVVGDIRDASDIDRVFSEARPEIVFHCAAKVVAPNEELYESNIRGTDNICRICLKHKVNRLIYLSSVAVISGNPEAPLTENLPYKASDAYGSSKIEAERIVMDYRRKGLSVAVIRPCMVYGEDEPHVLDKILKLVSLRRLPLLNVPAMNSKLHLVHVDNVVQALWLALKKEEALHGTFMIADREIITLKKFLEILYDELGKGYPPVVPYWLANFLMIIPSFRRKVKRLFKDRVYSITRAVNELGYNPLVTTEEGLRRTVRYWKSCRSLL